MKGRGQVKRVIAALGVQSTKANRKRTMTPQSLIEVQIREGDGEVAEIEEARSA